MPEINWYEKLRKSSRRLIGEKKGGESKFKRSIVQEGWSSSNRASIRECKSFLENENCWFVSSWLVPREPNGWHEVKGLQLLQWINKGVGTIDAAKQDSPANHFYTRQPVITSY